MADNTSAEMLEYLKSTLNEKAISIDSKKGTATIDFPITDVNDADHIAYLSFNAKKSKNKDGSYSIVLDSLEKLSEHDLKNIKGALDAVKEKQESNAEKQAVEQKTLNQRNESKIENLREDFKVDQIEVKSSRGNLKSSQAIIHVRDGHEAKVLAEALDTTVLHYEVRLFPDPNDNNQRSLGHAKSHMKDNGEYVVVVPDVQDITPKKILDVKNLAAKFEERAADTYKELKVLGDKSKVSFERKGRDFVVDSTGINDSKKLELQTEAANTLNTIAPGSARIADGELKLDAQKLLAVMKSPTAGQTVALNSIGKNYGEAQREFKQMNETLQAQIKDIPQTVASAAKTAEVTGRSLADTATKAANIAGNGLSGVKAHIHKIFEAKAPAQDKAPVQDVSFNSSKSAPASPKIPAAKSELAVALQEYKDKGFSVERAKALNAQFEKIENKIDDGNHSYSQTEKAAFKAEIDNSLKGTGLTFEDARNARNNAREESAKQLAGGGSVLNAEYQKDLKDNLDINFNKDVSIAEVRSIKSLSGAEFDKVIAQVNAINSPKLGEAQQVSLKDSLSPLAPGGKGPSTDQVVKK